MDTHSIINLLHILFVTPLFLYVSIQRNDNPDAMFNFLLVLGGFITLYHLFKSYMKYKVNSPFLWVNLIHVFYVGPLLIYIGYNKKETPRVAYEILMLLAFAAGGYHLYQLAHYTTFSSQSSKQPSKQISDES
jgi:hypothetical protein